MSDYILDWASANIDGNNTIGTGSDALSVDISTPNNLDGQSLHIGTLAGGSELLVNCVDEPTKVQVTFDEPVENVSFELFDIDSDNCNWDDRVTIIALDADGNPVTITLSDLTHHTVKLNADGSVKIDANDNVSTGVEGSGAGDSVTVTIPGPLSYLEIIVDNGSSADTTKTVGVGDLHFDSVSTLLDGYVDGTNGNDIINAAYVGDPDGDRIDANDQILPGEGAQDDVVLAGAGNDFVVAGAGSDEIYGGTGNDTLCGNDGDDTVYGGKGNDILEGMNNNDLLFGQDGADRIMGDAGDDVIVGGTGADSITGGSGADFIQGGIGNDKIDGGTGDDTVYGGSGADSITGGDGNDVLAGNGVAHTGTINFNDLSTGELVNGQYVAQGVHIYSADPHHPVMVFDSANPTGGDGDLATGNLGNVLILSEDRDGTDPDDNAGGGTFVIEFDGPAYVGSLDFLDIEGGAWIKMYDANGTLIGQIDTASTADGGQLHQVINQGGVVRMEVIIPNSGAIDNLSYTLDANAGDGADVIDGGAGDDYIIGGAGNDVMSGGTGNDTFDDVSGSANDGLGDDTVYGGAGDDKAYTGIGNDHLFGGEGNDRLFGESGDDSITGGAGDDYIEGGSGNDVIHGDGEGVCEDDETDYFPERAQDISNMVFYYDTNGDGLIDYSVKVDGFPDGGSPTWISNDADDFYSQMNNWIISENPELDGADVTVGVSIKGGIVEPTQFFSVDGDTNGPVSDTGPVMNTGPGNDEVVEYADFFPIYDPSLTGGGGTSGTFDDVIFGGAGDDTIFGDCGDDVITGGDGNDALFGGDDADVIHAAAGDTVDGGAGGRDYDILDLTG